MNCGCHVDVRDVTRIVYCPLHTAAGELLAACQDVSNEQQPHGPVCGFHLRNPCDCGLGRMRQILATIAATTKGTP